MQHLNVSETGVNFIPRSDPDAWSGDLNIAAWEGCNNKVNGKNNSLEPHAANIGR